MIRTLLPALTSFLALFLLTGCGGGSTTATPETDADYTPPVPVNPLGADTAAAATALLAANADKNAIRGEGDWLFSPNELRFLSKGEFWGARMAQTSAAANKSWADPLLGINSFQNNLTAKGIELIILPVPPKATVYPDKLPGMAAPQASDALPRFIKYLRESGIQVVDLTAAMTKARSSKPMHCTTDTHWSPQAIELAADTLYNQLKGKPWAAGIAKETYDVEEKTISYPGDLVELSGESIAAESFTVRRVTKGGAVLPEDPDSPILVMGDSHTLFCHEPNMVTNGAGLSDHLALRFGCPIDLLGIKGSASSATRQTLLSRKNRAQKAGNDYLGKKKVIIWCFTAREFTESTGGWRDLDPKYWK